MEEMTPTYKPYWQVAKALKADGTQVRNKPFVVHILCTLEVPHRRRYLYISPPPADSAPLTMVLILEDRGCTERVLRRVTDRLWCVKNSVLHTDLELSIISKYIKDESERLFNIAINHPNPLIFRAAYYESPPENNFIRRPRIIFTDPSDEGVLHALCHSKVPPAFEAPRDSLHRGDPSGFSSGESRTDSIFRASRTLSGHMGARVAHKIFYPPLPARKNIISEKFIPIRVSSTASDPQKKPPRLEDPYYC
ncbi:hypothetical protein EVAR_97937_1 [Eumeta japonica]|uniref:Uncharacterized protein n=1 Tax=Eumeta variegata TaxID=151549 RepID=A0A4C1XYB9_EUMVA|nr:hypothetical protein EVAR_97937_1 [Eumeta japonica]